MTNHLTLDALCTLVDLPKRTVRYYMGLGLVDRPIGETRAAHYTDSHVQQLLTIKQLAASGVSLERIRQVLSGEEAPVAPKSKSVGDIRVVSHVHIAPGVELQIDPAAASLSPETLREFIRAALAQWEEIHDKS